MAGDTIHLILNMSETKLSYYLNHESSNRKVLTDSIETGDDIKYTFALSLYPYSVTSSINVTQKFLDE